MNLKTIKPLIFTLSAGVLGLCWRLTLYRTGFDEKNILSASHRLHLGCLVLTILVAVYLLWKVRRPEEADSLASPVIPLGPICCFGAGCLMALHGVSLAREIASVLDTVRTALALGSALALASCALVPGKFRNLHALCHGLISAFFALDMLCRYRGWSGNPQLPDYVFHVFACVLLSLTSYHRLALDTGSGKPGTLKFCSLMSLYLCLLCAAGPDPRPFFLGGALWAAACAAVPSVEPDAPSV